MQNLAGLNDIELIQSARSGNLDAFQALVFRYDRNVLSIAVRYAQNSEDAKDIYQDVFIRVYRNLGSFKQQSEFGTWLYRITTNVCISYYRSRKKYTAMYHAHEMNGKDVTEISHERGNGDGTPHEAMMSTEISARVSNAVNLLSPQQKLVFTLRHYEGYKLSEIAKFMKCTEGTVKKQLFTAIRRLRGELQDLYFEGIGS
jgi:RNA polymerase sigma-70 factor, ECF subfamily